MKKLIILVISILFIPMCVNAENKYLYDVLKNEAESNGLAREYTGEHHDSFTEEPNHKIYHWYAENREQGNQVLEKNNVIFANHCWQMIRTTDTGGIKMIYNGEVADEKCLSSRDKHVGYEGITSAKTMKTTYYYGTDYTYDSSAKNFKLSGNITTGEIKTEQYTCMATTADSTCTTLYYVDSLYNGTRYYVLILTTNSNYSQFGKLHYNFSMDSSPSSVGYMYNTVYDATEKYIPTYTETILSSSSLETTYWYAHDVVWGSPTADKYNLNNPYKVSSTTDYPNLVGEYTFKSTNKDYTNTRVYYIAAVNDTTFYFIELSHIGNNSLSDFNYTYTYGNSYTDNGDGTYTIENPTTINRSDWYTDY